MKKITKIFSLVLALMMMLSIGAMAREIDWGDLQTVTAVASVDEIKAGETFTVSVYLTEDTYKEDIELLGGYGITYKLLWDKDVFTVDSVVHNYSVPTNNMVSNEGEYRYNVEATVDGTITSSTPLSVYTFKVADTAVASSTPYTFSFDADFTSVGEFGGTTYGACYDFTHVTDAVTVAAAGGNEEIFDVNVQGTATANDVAFYAKNTTGAELAAGTYGVFFGGVKYPAGVNPDTACAADATFVVKFTGGNLSGTYNYQAYYNSGADTTDVKTVTID